MCRITVFSGNNLDLTFQPVNLVLSVTIKNSERANRDGVGFYLSGSDAIYKSYKAAEAEYKEPKIWEWFSEKVTPNSQIIAHVRQATVGKNLFDSDMSHPFNFEYLTGVHNGHFENWKEVAEEEGWKEILLDSELFLKLLKKNIDEKEPEESMLQTIQKTVDRFIGPFVVVFTIKPGEIWAVLGKGRTLGCYSNDKVVILNTDLSILPEISFEWRKAVLGTNINPVLEFKKLEEDTVYRVTDATVENIGKITSREDLPKKVTAVTVFRGENKASLTSSETTATGEYLIKMSAIQNGYNRRLDFCKDFNLEGGLYDTFINATIISLYPMFFGALFTIGEHSLKLLTDFLHSLPKETLENLEVKTKCWDQICGLFDSNMDQAVVACYKANEEFVEPYYLNTVKELDTLLEKFIEIFDGVDNGDF